LSAVDEHYRPLPLHTPKSGSPSFDSALRPSGLDLLQEVAEERHQRIFADDHGFPRMPPGFHADDFVGEEVDGFVKLPEAASRMGKTEQEILDLARSGVLRAYAVSGAILVQPAVVYDQSGRELTA
jgi:hypothetical protein